MNSLAYLSRQLDGWASPKSKPKSPRSDHPPADSQTQRPANPTLHRVHTWSSKAFLLSDHSGSSSSLKHKRSSSSPSIVLGLQLRQRTNSASPMPSVSFDHSTRGISSIDSFMRRIYLLRVLLLVWDNLRTAWARLVATFLRRELAILDTPTIEAKDSSEDEMDDPLVTRAKPQPPTLPTQPAEFSLLVVETPTIKLEEPEATPPLPPSPPSDQGSRSATPILRSRKPAFHLPKTLVLDLDETLIHSTSRPMHMHFASASSGFFGLGNIGKRNKVGGHTVEVFLHGRSTLYHVYKRPFVDFFLRTVSSWYTLVIFTASMREYADPVIDWLDNGRGILTHRLFRDSCTQLPNGCYTKDLSIVEADLSRVCLVDNSPISYKVNEANGIPIEGWTHDPHDEALLDLLPVLDSLRFTSDVRRILGLRIAGTHVHHHS